MTKLDWRDKNYHKNYYQEHKEEQKTQGKERYLKNRKRRLEQMKTYREEHKEERKRYLKKNREHFKAYAKERNKSLSKETQKKRKEIFELLGGKCFICSFEKIERLRFHKKDNKSHPKHPNHFDLILKNPEDWVALCSFCHRHVHWCMEFLKMSWVDIEKEILKADQE